MTGTTFKIGGDLTVQNFAAGDMVRDVYMDRPGGTVTVVDRDGRESPAGAAPHGMSDATWIEQQENEPVTFRSLDKARATDWTPWFDRLRDAVEGLTDHPILMADIAVPYRHGISLGLCGGCFMTRWGAFEIVNGERDGDQWIVGVREMRIKSLLRMEAARRESPAGAAPARFWQADARALAADQRDFEALPEDSLVRRWTWMMMRWVK